MGKIVIIFSFLSLFVYAETLQVKDMSLQDACLSCHQEQQIPSTLIYKRYLKKYSTATHMEEAIFTYMKHPIKEHSIMPSAFFLKFPMKEAKIWEDTSLRKNIQAYLSTFDLKKKLVLEK